MKLKLGADPEFFLMKDGEPVSAHDLVPGTKQDPYRLDGGAVQADGTAVEFNIDPAEDDKEFAQKIAHVLAQVRELVPREYQFAFLPSVRYGQGYFRKIPTTSKMLGCDPDYDAWHQGRMNPRPRPPHGHATLRTGAGHLHLGWGEKIAPHDPDHMFDCCAIVMALDQTINSVAKAWDDDRLREKLYGKLGAFRPKPYGVEYRVLSNAWLNYPGLWPWISQTVRWVVDYVETEGSIPYWYNLGYGGTGRWDYVERYLPYHLVPRNRQKEKEPWLYRF